MNGLGWSNSQEVGVVTQQMASNTVRVPLTVYWLICSVYEATVVLRGGDVSESDARPEGRAFKSRPICDVRLCSWEKHYRTSDVLTLSDVYDEIAMQLMC